MMNVHRMIDARGLARTFSVKGQEVHAVKGIDIQVEEGELVGFLGPNGAGKTTTLRMLTTLLRPTAGRATVGGCDLLADPVGVRRTIGYVSQGGSTWPQSTVLEELELQGRLHRLPKAEIRRRAGRLMGLMALEDVADRPTASLSGGQRRKLDIALGLIHEPRLLFLDEPTAGLDPQARASLWDLIQKLNEHRGLTVLLTTHYLEEADALSDRILIIDHGTIVAEGSPDELKARVSGDVIVLVTAENDADAAAEVVGLLNGTTDVSLTDHQTVRFRVPRGDVAVPEVMRALERHHLNMLSVSVKRPTLDDSFLSITGRELRTEGQFAAF